MNMSNYLSQFAVALVTFLAVDLVWLGFLAKGIYQKYLGELMRTNPIWSSALVFYALFVIGLVYFAIAPALKEGSLSKAAINGAIFGFMTYMTYELTNYAVLKNWPLGIVFIDIIWGVVLATTVSVVTFLIFNHG